MAEHPTLHLASRTLCGSQCARRLRRDARIPGIIYGHGEAMPVTVDLYEFRGTVPRKQYGSLLVNLTLDGRAAGTALVRAVQVNPLGQRILNVDFQRVSLREFVTVSVPLALQGRAEGERAGGILDQVIYTVSVRCRAGDVPEQLMLDISWMQVGDTVPLSSIALPRDAELQDDPESVAVVLAAPIPTEVGEEEVVSEEVAGPDLTNEKQHDDFQGGSLEAA